MLLKRSTINYLSIPDRRWHASKLMTGPRKCVNAASPRIQKAKQNLFEVVSSHLTHFLRVNSNPSPFPFRQKKSEKNVVLKFFFPSSATWIVITNACLPLYRPKLMTPYLMRLKYLSWRCRFLFSFWRPSWQCRLFTLVLSKRAQHILHLFISVKRA